MGFIELTRTPTDARDDRGCQLLFDYLFWLLLILLRPASLHWPPIGPFWNMYVINILICNFWHKNGGLIWKGYGATIYFGFSPCVSDFYSPAFPVPLPQIWHCSIVIIYNAYILKQRSIGATSEMHLFPAKVGAKYAVGPTEPLRSKISSKCQWFQYNIKYLAFRWGTGGFELGGELSGTGRVGVSRGRPPAPLFNLLKCCAPIGGDWRWCAGDACVCVCVCV